MSDLAKYHDHSDDESFEPFTFIDLEDCKKSGQHLESCDPNGFCQSCGNQEFA